MFTAGMVQLISITLIHFSGDGSENATVMIIGNNNVFEVDCVVKAAKIGDNNIVESKGT